MLNPKVDIPLFATNANPIQLYHSRRAKILAFKDEWYCAQMDSVSNMFAAVTKLANPAIWCA